MSRILLIDSNPDNRKSLEGLLRYRTQHEFCMVDNHTDGARQAVSLAPDLIMMNVLLFMGNNYAFPRVLQQHDKTQNISFLVQVNGHLDDVTERQIQASGMANIVYLPVSAEELEAAIYEALNTSGATATNEVAPVVWPQAGNKHAETSNDSFGSGDSSSTPNIKPVEWPVASEQQPPPVTPVKHVAPQKSAPSVSRSKGKKQTSGFRPATFDQVKERSKVSGPSEFKTQQWQTVDPKDLINRK